MIPELLEFSAIQAAYAAGTLTPTGLAKALSARIAAYPDKAVFISLVPEAELLAQAAKLEAEGPQGKPLYGIPFVTKDNIDVAGMPTTAACPDFAYVPAQDATTIARLRAAGALLVGKANLDQFATGLNGTRSPYGAPRSVFNAAYVSGGSSSGSGVAVGAGLAAFSLGTDTAGSGRIPAAFNNIIGLKPSIGRLSAAGVVPACKSLDCISVCANSAADAMAVLSAAEGYDAQDAYSRAPSTHALPATPRLGVLAAKDKDFAEDNAAAALYDAALAKAQALGWELVEIDYAPFRDIAALLYGGAFVAERLAATRAFMKDHADAVHPVVRGIIEGGAKFSAADTFDDIYKVQALRQAYHGGAGKMRCSAAAHRPHHLHGGGHAGRAREAQFHARPLHQFRESAGHGRHRPARRVQAGWPALRRHLHRPGLLRGLTLRLCRYSAQGPWGGLRHQPHPAANELYSTGGG